MMAVTFFTFIFILVITLASVEPWKIPSEGSKGGRNTREIADMIHPDCIHTYTAYQPNMDFFKEKLAEITVDKCNPVNKKKKKRDKKRRRKGASLNQKDSRKGRKRKSKNRNGKTKIKNKSQDKDVRKSFSDVKKRRRPKTKSRKLNKRRRKSKKKKRKVFRELENFRKWKSLMSKGRLDKEALASLSF